MPTRRERINTSSAVIVGICTWVTTGLFGSSKIRVFIVSSQRSGQGSGRYQATRSILPLRAEANTASSRAMLFTRCSAVIG